MGSETRWAVVGAVALLGAAASASACLWDSDVLRFQAQGMPAIEAVITGRFERNPPLYFAARLTRAERTIAADPDALSAYDDAGVACDRLGRCADAIRWMEKKKARLATHADDTEQEYRLHANLGTFLADDWRLRGADRADTSELRRGRDEIAQAVGLRADAPFGREAVQVASLTWRLDPPPWDGQAVPGLLLSGAAAEGVQSLKPADAARGLAGRVLLGTAWESPDVFAALAAALEDDGREVPAELARLRVRDLARSGARSVYPGAPAGDDLATALVGRRKSTIRGARAAAISAWYDRARAAADRWNAEREAYLVPRLRAGNHPDWDPTFWNAFDPSAAAAEPSPSRIEWDAYWGGLVAGETPELVGTSIGAALLALLVTLTLWFLRRRRRIRASRPGARLV